MTSPERRRLSLFPLPTGMAAGLAGLLGFVASIYFVGRGAHLLVIALCAGFIGAALALMVSAAQGERITLPRSLTWGALAGYAASVAHTSITNPGACGTVWSAVMMIIAPLTGVVAAVVAAALTAIVGLNRVPARRGGDRKLLPVLALTAVACGAAVAPFAVNAASFLGVLTGASLQVLETTQLSPGGEWVRVGDLMVRPALSLSPETVYEAYALDGRFVSRTVVQYGEGGGAVGLLVDGVTGQAYVVWVERAGVIDSEEAYSASVALLDLPAGILKRTWRFGPRTGTQLFNVRAVAQGLLFGYSCDSVAAFELSDAATPAPVWSIESPEPFHLVASESTLIALIAGQTIQCFEAATGTPLWSFEGSDMSLPVFDGSGRRWIAGTRTGLRAFDELTGEEGWGHSLDRSGDTRCWPVHLALSGRVYSLLRGSPGGFSGATLLVAVDTAAGEPAWETPVEEAAMAIVGEASGVLFVCTSSGLVLGFDARTGDKLFRTKVGAISRVAPLTDGSLALFDESGAIHRARVVRR